MRTHKTVWRLCRQISEKSVLFQYIKSLHKDNSFVFFYFILKTMYNTRRIVNRARNYAQCRGSTMRPTSAMEATSIPLSPRLARIRLELKWIINDVLANQFCPPIINYRQGVRFKPYTPDSTRILPCLFTQISFSFRARSYGR